MSWFDKNDRTSSSHFDGVQLPSRAPPSLCFLPSPVRQQDAGSCAIESVRSAAGASGARQVGQPSGGAAAGTTVAAQGPGGAGGGAARPGRPPWRSGLAGRAEGRRQSFERREVDPGRCGGGAAGARGARRRGRSAARARWSSGGAGASSAGASGAKRRAAHTELDGGRSAAGSGGARRRAGRGQARDGGGQRVRRVQRLTEGRGGRRPVLDMWVPPNGANGIRSLLMLILPTKQKMEPLHPSNQT